MNHSNSEIRCLTISVLELGTYMSREHPFACKNNRICFHHKKHVNFEELLFGWHAHFHYLILTTSNGKLDTTEDSILCFDKLHSQLFTFKVVL